MALPFALFVFPLPEGRLWLVLGGVFFIHALYKWLMAMAYSRGAYTAVYPVVRGTGPLGTVVLAWLFFHESFRPLQWAGVLLLSGGIMGLALVNIAAMEHIGRRTLRAALLIAFASGLTVSAYTAYDAFGIRLAPDPFTFLAWFFVIDGLLFPLLAIRWYARMPEPPPLRPLALRGMIGGLIGFVSFGGVMLATRLDKVGEAAALRETSVIFAAVIGWALLGERIGWARAGLMGAIALGAVLVETG
ncbi:DMT family transporter [Paralimibaculum aggregatum]|uniref:DMT family transporter n=2 Tax=Paralimibaculum aggregatum TaxID=3036245 RepID=A0ABQ6LFA8_9RHOB|nr:DMT family transporter [Limibaculum sp. NKW23]